MTKRVTILGSTGSIGRQGVEVIDAQPGLCACGLAAGSNWQELVAQARRLGPQAVAIQDARAAEDIRIRIDDEVELLTGTEAMVDLVRRTQPDMLLSGVVGSTGLAPTLAAIELGADLAIANKETLVMAGDQVMAAARAAGVAVLPVDSEHSAIYQCLASGRRSEVRKVVITASGGALREMDDDQAAAASVDEALDHPTWAMGRKITIDSATLINKALEVVEAHWLFDLGVEQIQVVLHPQSIIHSYVEFCDGSVIAQMGQPDMTLPIAYALTHPDRPVRRCESLDLSAVGELTFAPLEGRFARGVALGFEVIRRGGLAGAVLNGANEAAVAAFLDGRIRFGQIVPLVERILQRTDELHTGPATGLDAVLAADAWARQQVCQALEQPAPPQTRT